MFSPDTYYQQVFLLQKGIFHMAVNPKSFAVQNWIITPAAIAVNEAPPVTISDQIWQLVLSGVAVVDFVGNNPDDWRRDTLSIFPDWRTPVSFAIDRYGIPQPPESPSAFQVSQWTPFAGVSSAFERASGTTDLGFAVDAWRATFSESSGLNGQPMNQLFDGIDVDIAVRNNLATLHRINFQITLTGKIVFIFEG
jgi:hypothetical protein